MLGIGDGKVSTFGNRKSVGKFGRFHKHRTLEGFNIEDIRLITSGSKSERRSVTIDRCMKKQHNQHSLCNDTCNEKCHDDDKKVRLILCVLSEGSSPRSKTPADRGRV